MRYALAILLPSIAMLTCGKLFQAILCVFLQMILIGWPLASIWAMLVVNNFYAERRHRQLMRVTQGR